MNVPASDHVAQRVTDELLSFIELQRPAVEPEARVLLDELASLVASGGKRIRPRFCYWGHIAGGGNDGDAIIRAGAALELLHTFALIHDDVMDGSARRRSRPSSSETLAGAGAAQPHRGDPRRFGASAALLCGLLGFVLADRLLLGSGFDPDALTRAAERYDLMRMAAISGQYMDLLAAHRGDTDEAKARRIGTLKSGTYSITGPLAIGALCATPDRDVIAMLDRYGDPLGEAFQIRDDVLGVFGDPAVTGKDCDGDLREGKQTVLLARARDGATERDRDFLERVVGCAGITHDDADRVREIFVSTGALQSTEELISSLVDRGSRMLDERVVGTDASRALLTLAGEVAQRSA